MMFTSMRISKISSKYFYNKKLHRVSSCRYIFSINGLWDAEITADIKNDIENHWKKKVNSPCVSKGEEKFYLLSMFPYPSGNLHMGHVRVYTISDAIARFLRMNGKKVIHPIGWDAFGLPAENAALERNIHPFQWTTKNISTMKNQLESLNISFNWDMELATCDPSYYKWTQYLFLLLYEHGFAYKKQALVNWDPVDQTVLADEQVDENGFSWRSGCKAEKRRLSQWFLRTSAFSKNLYDGLSDPKLVEWRDVVKIQKHWIGVCNGYTFLLDVYHKDTLLKDKLSVWTDIPEFFYGATFIAISPDNHFNMADLGGGKDAKDTKLDLHVIHPLTGRMIPVFVTRELDHSPATDSCLGIPIQTKENFLNFASKHNLEVIQVVDNSNFLTNSGEFSGMDLTTARENIIKTIKEKGIKVYQSSERLRDWLISRQRYWGTPIPIINCPSCKTVPVPIKDLPVLLPKLSDFSGKHFSLNAAENWKKVNCPRCGNPAVRETDTLDTFVDSSWYFLRYLDVKNDSQPFWPSKVNAFIPVDLYIGGKEHAALHLFYARFISYFLHSLGLLKYPEPFLQLLMQGMIMGQSYRVGKTGKYLTKEEVDFSGPKLTEKTTGVPVIEEWEKMSKSKYNGIDPKKVISEHGIDTTRLFILGNVAPQSPRKWNEELFPGIQNWQRRMWLTVGDFLEQRKAKESQSPLSPEDIKKYENDLYSARNYYIKGVTHNMINTRQLSVAISKLQGLTGELRRVPKVLAQHNFDYEQTLAALIIMLAPLAPHFASELWTAFGSVATGGPKCSYNMNEDVLHQSWPKTDIDCEMKINIKLNGEECDTISMSQRELLSLPEDKAIQLALDAEKVQKALEGIKIKHARYKAWPSYDSEVNIIYKPLGKKGKKLKMSASI